MMIKRKKKKVVKLPDEVIVNKIHHIRGHRVIMDKDLAELYGVKPTRLREQVKRNLRKFPTHFMFQLNSKETRDMVSQNVIPSTQHLGGYLPYAFTEHGVLQLANVLNSEIATAVGIRVIEVFVKMREMMAAHKDILMKIQQLEKRIDDHGGSIQKIFLALKKLLSQAVEPRREIGFRQYEK